MDNAPKEKDYLFKLRQAVAKDLALKQTAAARGLKAAGNITPEQRQELCALAEQMRRVEYLAKQR